MPFYGAREQLVDWCNDCMHDADQCVCAEEGCGLEEYPYEYTPCTCRLCYCGNVTGHGGKCNDCLNGVHQG